MTKQDGDENNHHSVAIDNNYTLTMNSPWNLVEFGILVSETL